MKEWITSDYHFGHKNITGPEGFCTTRRHLKDAEEMNAALIAAHNAVVSNDDRTYHLGDLTVGLKPQQIHELLMQMKGSFIFILGNHDSQKAFKKLNTFNYELPCGRMKYESFELVGKRLKANKKVYYLTHYPMGLGDKRLTLRNLCGHIHEDATTGINLLNVGIDSTEIGERPFGEPLLLEEAMRLVDEKYERHQQLTAADIKRYR